ncbi:MAG TPA: HD domain-containing protein [Verrucomicrobiae bacterium]|nr:HD domain-containing protein [Verrucomicrobiae bacterium]
MTADLERIFAFTIELDRLKAVLRKTKPVGLDRYENTAEHSWQVCLLALALTKYAVPSVDPVRVVELLLVHDIPEIDAGDQIVYAGLDPTHQDKERAAASRIFGLLPKEQGEWFLSRWKEFVARETPEARFAYAMDRLMPVLHNIYNKGQSWRENRIPLDKVLAVNAAIGDACPDVWAHIKKRVEEMAGLMQSHASDQ